ncbi:MAG: hypothetical protein AAGD00_04695 [Planctomycetota bacterium]
MRSLRQLFASARKRQAERPIGEKVESSGRFADAVSKLAGNSDELTLRSRLDAQARTLDEAGVPRTYSIEGDDWPDGYIEKSTLGAIIAESLPDVVSDTNYPRIWRRNLKARVPHHERNRQAVRVNLTVLRQQVRAVYGRDLPERAVDEIRLRSVA